MHRGHFGRAVAAGMLAVCLLLAIPQTSEARGLQPSSHDQIARPADPPRELAFWEQIWSTLFSTWAKVSVLIDPEG